MNLHHQARLGDTKAVEQALAQGAAVDERDGRGFTPLMHAAGSTWAGVDLLQVLLESGADPNAAAETTRPGDRPADTDRRTVLSEALAGGRPAKIRLLVEAGADVHYQRPRGYAAMLDLVYGRDIRRDDGLLPAARFLLDQGVTPNPVSDYGESPLRKAVFTGRFDLVEVLLSAGVPAADLGWSEPVLALLFRSEAESRQLWEDGASIEKPDRLGLTPFHLAVLQGDVAKARLLTGFGADPTVRTTRGQSPVALAVQAGRPEMLAWLLDQGASLEALDPLYQQTPLQMAVINNSAGCLRVLLERGANPRTVDAFGEKPVSAAFDLGIARQLLAAGEDVNDLNLEMRHALLGLDDTGFLDVPPQAYKAGRGRRFGRHNPEEITEPFWRAMVRTRLTAWTARMAFDDRPAGPDQPVWCNHRFGQTITALRDGRYVEIGGEHEDWYDVDFCIYNEVVVYDGRGGFTIYGYPETVFPPTDFHTATLVGNTIIIIGNLGYRESRRPGETPVYRLHLDSWRIEKSPTTGTVPGWISRHEAVLVDGREIVVSGGKVEVEDGSQRAYIDQAADFVLELESLSWRRLD